jgi:hypothetical protein
VEDVKHIEEHIVRSNAITEEEAAFITEIFGTDLFNLFASANKIRSYFRGI